MTEREELEDKITIKKQLIKNRKSDVEYYQGLVVIAEKDLKALEEAYKNLTPVE